MPRLTGDTIHFIQRAGLPQTITGLAAGTWHVLNTIMSDPVEVLGLPGQLRAASTDASKHLHSGHSLTNDYAAWHRNMVESLLSVGVTAPYQTMINSTMPGSSMVARRNHEFDDSRAQGGIGADVPPRYDVPADIFQRRHPRSRRNKLFGAGQQQPRHHDSILRARWRVAGVAAGSMSTDHALKMTATSYDGATVQGTALPAGTDGYCRLFLRAANIAAINRVELTATELYACRKLSSHATASEQSETRTRN